MDFSLDGIDALLDSPHDSPYDGILSVAEHDIGLFADDLFSPVSNPSMVLQTIKPSQLRDTSSSPELTGFSSGGGSPTFIAENTSQPRRPRRINKRNTKSQQQDAINSRSDSHERYDAGHHRVKRHQTKLACTWCRKLNKKCDAQRPCGRCVQFNRCSECVDAPPRKPRTTGFERGMYKKNRDFVAVDEDDVSKREAYPANREKMSATAKLGLTADAFLERTRKDETNMEKEVCQATEGTNIGGDGLSPPLMGDVTLDGRSPFTGPLEDLFTFSASPGIEKLSFFSSLPSSPENSLFDIPTPANSDSSVTECHESNQSSSPPDWHWQTMDMFPNVMEVVADAQTGPARKF